MAVDDGAELVRRRRARQQLLSDPRGDGEDDRPVGGDGVGELAAVLLLDGEVPRDPLLVERSKGRRVGGALQRSNRQIHAS